MGVMVWHDLQSDMLLRNAFNCGRQGAEIVDIGGIGEDCACERAGLRARIPMMRLIEEIANFRILEHPGVHLPDNVQAMGLKGWNCGFDDRDRPLAEGLRHQ
ncbi:hypothetical protein HNP32_003513 [Brevundimonas bullata]|uniref:Uncharacterized protein n=1 Tax=Brevundimonas bullata TaxID=13160 RepID=A0A7W7ISZ3_9CAUL|nr:hypothetical protein [Brevundimonas bullata]MBB6384625.1 hypothetical protein [Brevundimonas bullata]